MSAGDVQNSLGDGLAYNTVQTTLIRLMDKDLVEREKVGRAHLYGPTTDEASLTAQRMCAYLAPGADHAPVLAQFLATLDAADAAVLGTLLADQDQAKAAQRDDRMVIEDGA